MHLIFGLRGIKTSCDALINDLQAQFFPMKIKVKNEKGVEEEKTMWVQGGLRPIALYEYVFPKEYLEEVYHSMGIQKEEKYKFLDKYLYFIRKIFKADPVPDFPPPSAEHPTSMRLIRHADVSIIPIGIKDDLDNVPYKTGEFKSEAL